jgi:hypothetical protein
LLRDVLNFFNIDDWLIPLFNLKNINKERDFPVILIDQFPADRKIETKSNSPEEQEYDLAEMSDENFSTVIILTNICALRLFSLFFCLIIISLKLKAKFRKITNN